MITIANTSTEVWTAPNGDIYLGPLTATAPTSASSALTLSAAQYTHLGYASEDGVSITPSTDTNDIMAWQSIAPVKTVLTSAGLEISFTLLQTNEASVEAFFLFNTLVPVGSGAGTSMTISTTPPSQERSLIIDWQTDAGEKSRLYFPRAMCTERQELQLQRSEAFAYGLTFVALDSNGTLAKFFSEIDALALAS